jgi:hypothetical protein
MWVLFRNSHFDPLDTSKHPEKADARKNVKGIKPCYCVRL